MPRIHQNAERYASEDFRREIRARQGFHDLMSVRALARATGIPHSTLNPWLHEPERITVEAFQKLVPVIHPDPGVVLTLLGYTRQEIKKFKEA